MILVKDNNGKIHQTTDGTNAIIPSLNVAQEVLWTNPNPGQQFAAQSVNLTDNPFNYDYIAVYYQNGYLREGKYYKGYEVKTFKPLQNFLGVIDTLVLNEEQLVSRQIYNFTENSVTFSDCLNKGYTWNDWLSPMKIIGIKFLDTLNYSTEEQYTGKHWIDGKKIYQKTVDCGAVGGSNKDVTVAVNNVEYITSFSGICKTTSNEFLSIGYNNSGNKEACFNLVIDTITSTSLMLKINAGRLINTTSTYITIYYTKTTE